LGAGLALVDEVGSTATADMVNGSLVLAAGVHLLVELEHGLLSLRGLGDEVTGTATTNADGTL
jgi:hypothetical protein